MSISRSSTSSLRRPRSISDMRKSAASASFATVRDGAAAATSRSSGSSRASSAAHLRSTVSTRLAAAKRRREENEAAPARNLKSRKAAENSPPSNVIAKTGKPSKPVSSIPPRPKRRLTEREVREKLTKTIATLKEVRAELAAKTQEVERLLIDQQEIQSRIDKLVSSANENEATQKSLNAELKAVRVELGAKSAQEEALNLQISSLKSQITELEASCAASNQAVFRLEGDLAVSKASLSSSEALAARQASEIAELQAKIQQHLQCISDLEERARDDEVVRRKLHNDIQELKGNIRVFCRVRPKLSQDSPMACTFPGRCDDTAIQILGKETSSVDGSSISRRTHDFAFDRVFRPHHTQEHIWTEIQQLCTSALDGYKVIVFAYGQTGSGKTFTMEGPQGEHMSAESEGMIPRSICQLFKCMEQNKSKEWSYTCKAMFVEIYNENIADLLARGGKASEELKIKHNEDGSTEVSGVSVVEVKKASEVYALLERAKSNRSVAKTLMNDRSSRSHSVFQLTLEGANSASGEKTHGILNLVDLAGSERLKRSAAEGDRLKETQCINKSLSALSEVISKLANQSTHVPFRNSKLTYLLKNCFGGDCKCLMFVCIGPEEEHSGESLCSLRFAKKVNACQIGTARRNVKVSL